MNLKNPQSSNTVNETHFPLCQPFKWKVIKKPEKKLNMIIHEIMNTVICFFCSNGENERDFFPKLIGMSFFIIVFYFVVAVG